LLREIQDGAVASHSDVAALLRRCMVLGTRLGNEPIRDWASLELNGYSPESDLPSYRPKITTQVLGTLTGIGGRELRNAALAPSALPSDWANWHDRLFTYEVREGVAQLELFANSEESTLSSPWPADVVATLSDEFYEMMTLLSARQIVPTTVFTGVLDGIRNRVLQLALEIERDVGEGDQAELSSLGPEAESRLTNIFMNTVYGDHASIVSSSIGHLNLASISTSLEAIISSESDRTELIEAIVDDGDGASPESPRVSQWLDRLSAGGIALAEGISIQAATAVILNLLGN